MKQILGFTFEKLKKFQKLLLAQLSGNMGCTNELFKVYGYVPGQKDTKVH